MSRSLRAGLILLGLLSVLDLLLPFLTDGEHPPMAIAQVTAVIGLASLVLVVSAWRGATRALVLLAILRGVSALMAVPAIFEPGVPTPVVLAVGGGLLVTLAGITLVFATRISAGAR